MGKYGSDDIGFLLIDGYDLLGSSTELSDSVEVATEESHGFSEAWVKQISTGLMMATLTQSGYFDDASANMNDALSGKSGVSRIVSYGLAGNTAGKSCVNWSGALQTNYNRIATRGELHKAKVDYQCNGIVEEGVIIQPHTQLTADGSSDDVDNGSGTAAGATLYLQVSAITLDALDTDCVITVEDSDDGETWATLATFTAITTAPIAERKTVTGAVSRYVRVSRAFTGTGTTSTIKIMVAIKRN